MFQLSVISDLIRISPHLFHLPTEEAVQNELNIKYANKVIHKLGLVVAVWDLLQVDDGLLKPGDGAVFINVRFRIVVFKPVVGEVLTGWIESCSDEGIKVNMNFFNDIFIPKNYMFEGSYYSADDNAWIWQMDEETKLYLDINEKINFRIEKEVFNDVRPKGPDNSLTSLTADDQTNGVDTEDRKVPPYALIASCQTDGMGCVSWWE
ncbi:hypothetical protein KL918_003328 [Ogataea parapolymorpha]|uniref:DNA-directed RNA polymerase subunit n=1 Tax=Ogataea parapolymorpha (strain ATCC 26012 / BCRC 20466 / JCM 22074 / NRRL Y-7560 / DL-1) TaxID=871575 RepID=W1Q6Q9_OGAPD|nr:DNA-directed RNA polymerase III subunit RPC8 [Ogataea parapolymorpha DL-1]ESW95769.1 DNA-directed RNA polymerase III subunit RPC8 [Ogataea parapolymorpha DL-1]KAG7866431.1 hypothetical protein KL918_003328 [Ogataea parapolymorpha]KAG7872633.1 hypothetical protein KL916_003028 [Ogataea parapolymorpha]